VLRASETAAAIVERAEKSIGDAGVSAEATAHKVLAQASETVSDLTDTGRSLATPSPGRSMANRSPRCCSLLPRSAISRELPDAWKTLKARWIVVGHALRTRELTNIDGVSR
jgi:hypothetical protein